MRPSFLLSARLEAGWFLLFLIAYYLPFVLDPSGIGVNLPGVRQLVAEALRVSAVWLELARNLMGHLLPIVAFYAALAWLSRRVASALRLDPSVSRAAYLLAGWILLVSANGVLFGHSDYSKGFSALAKPSILIVATGFLGASVGLALVQLHRTKRPTVWLASTLGVISLISLAAFSPSNGDQRVAASDSARNVIVIGLDSLSPQMLRAATAQLPNIASLLGAGVAFERAYTPLGRTFPAWVSLLSGKGPAEHGAIFNLRGLDHVERDDLVTRTLAQHGYRTVFAIDERRFSNLDESFGFDRVVGPTVGALDFLLQRVNDTPLTNLLLQWSISGHLLPFSRFNVASHANYDAAGFVVEVLRALSGSERIMLAVHFESAHFPFKTRHAVRLAPGVGDLETSHLRALTAVDAQVGQLLSGLRSRGYLDDALVVVVSDHGESLGAVEVRTTRDGSPVEVSAHGHGGSLISEYQSRVVLGAVQFRAGSPVGPSGTMTYQVSLTDVRAMIEQYAKSGAVALEPASECMVVETGIRFSAASNYQALDESKLAAESAEFYEIDSGGRLRLKEDRLPSLINGKDVGLRCKGRLTYFSAVDQRYFAYEIDDSATRFIETEARAGEVAKIEEYRKELLRIVQR